MQELLNSIGADNFQSFVFLGLGILGIIVFVLDARLKRRETIRQFDLTNEFRKNEFDRLEKLDLDFEKQADRQAKLFERTISNLSAKLKDDLVEDTTWLAQALGRSEFYLYQGTLFGDRSEHFKEEKEILANQFSELLIDYIQKLLKTKDKVVLVVDAGSTLYPFFRTFADLALSQASYRPKHRWVERLEIVTNNVPGAISLMGADQGVRSDGVAGMPLECSLVAGQPLTEYAAITGQDAIRSLKNILSDRRETNKSCYTISLVTGNWVRIKQNGAPRPVPLARGSGHLEFKQAAMHQADETFVVAPLGKVFVDTELDEINKFLKLDQNTDNLKNKAYEETDKHSQDHGIDQPKVRLVTTTRVSSAQLLRTHSAVLANVHGVTSSDGTKSNQYLDASSDKPILIKFDHEKSDKYDQMRLEFPHASTRRVPEFLAKFQVEEE